MNAKNLTWPRKIKENKVILIAFKKNRRIKLGKREQLVKVTGRKLSSWCAPMDLLRTELVAG